VDAETGGETGFDQGWKGGCEGVDHHKELQHINPNEYGYTAQLKYIKSPYSKQLGAFR
jgi:hypothetical protein